MTSICWKSAVTWSLLGLMLLLAALMYGPVPALAQEPDVVLYEVTEDMYLKDAAGKFVNSLVAGGRRTAVAQLSGWAKLGTPLCPAFLMKISSGPLSLENTTRVLFASCSWSSSFSSRPTCASRSDTEA